MEDWIKVRSGFRNSTLVKVKKEAEKELRPRAVMLSEKGKPDRKAGTQSYRSNGRTIL